LSHIAPALHLYPDCKYLPIAPATRLRLASVVRTLHGMALKLAALALVAFACVGCVHADRVSLATSTASLACDWGYTFAAARRGWDDQHEANPILGPTPSERDVTAYFGATIALNTMLWLALPRGYRSIVPFALTARQSVTLYQNATNSTGGACGL
jgi:hypothetical protein